MFWRASTQANHILYSLYYCHVILLYIYKFLVRLFQEHCMLHPVDFSNKLLSIYYGNGENICWAQMLRSWWTLMVGILHVNGFLFLAAFDLTHWTSAVWAWQLPVKGTRGNTIGFQRWSFPSKAANSPAFARLTMHQMYVCEFHIHHAIMNSQTKLHKNTMYAHYHWIVICSIYAYITIHLQRSAGIDLQLLSQKNSAKKPFSRLSFMSPNMGYTKISTFFQWTTSKTCHCLRSPETYGRDSQVLRPSWLCCPTVRKPRCLADFDLAIQYSVQHLLFCAFLLRQSC